MKRLWKRARPGLLSVLLCVPLAAATRVSAVAPVLYHSPNDDGVSGGVPATLPAAPGVTLHLYLGVGTTASSGDPCFQGDGDELCGHRLRLTGTGLEFQSFTPADPDLVFKLGPDELQVTGGDYQSGELGPTKLGDLVFDGLAVGGGVDLVLGEFVTTQLTKETAAVPTTIVQLPEPSGALPLGLGGGLLLLLYGRSSHPDRRLR
jgi:hypothetical protein